MKLVLILPIFVILVSFSFQESLGQNSIGEQIEKNDDSWFIGKNLNFHDYYKYKICRYDEKNHCNPFDMYIFVKRDIPSDKWIFEILINDTNKKIRGQIDVDKNSQTIMSNNEIKSYINSIRDFFGSRSIASKDNQQSFNNTNWQNVFSGNREINLELSKAHYTNQTGQEYSLQSVGGILYTFEPVLLSEEIPFPIKANYTIFDQDFIRFDDETTCEDGHVFIQRANTQYNKCVNFSTAYRWAELGLISMPKVGFELIEWQKPFVFLPQFLSYDPDIDDDAKLTYGSRVLIVKEGIDTPLPLPPKNTAIGIGLYASHTANNMAVRADYLDSNGNMKRLHQPLSNNEWRGWTFEERKFTKVWALAHYSFGGLIEIQYMQPEDELYHGGYPKANAGDDQIVKDQDFVILDGRKSVHPLGNNMTYQWSVFNGDTTLDMSSFTSPVAKFSTSQFKTPGVITFQLRVTDERMNQFSDTDNVIVAFDFSPLLQVKKGIASSNVICDDDLELILKPTSNLPACVLSDTVERLIEYGWIIPDKPIIQSKISEVAVTNVCNPDFKNKIIPKIIRVLLGVNSTVKWTNYGSCGQIIEHIIEYGVSDKEITSKIYGGDSDTITYYEKGTYHYRLKHYPEFSGTVIVE